MNNRIVAVIALLSIASAAQLMSMENKTSTFIIRLQPAYKSGPLTHPEVVICEGSFPPGAFYSQKGEVVTQLKQYYKTAIEEEKSLKYTFMTKEQEILSTTMTPIITDSGNRVIVTIKQRN